MQQTSPPSYLPIVLLFLGELLEDSLYNEQPNRDCSIMRKSELIQTTDKKFQRTGILLVDQRR
jgi:hypothetical protein